MAAAKDYQSYLKNKCIVGYGIVNGIVNALIFMGMHAGDADITFAAGKVVEEIALTGALLGLINSLMVGWPSCPKSRFPCRSSLASLPL